MPWARKYGYFCSGFAPDSRHDAVLFAHDGVFGAHGNLMLWTGLCALSEPHYLNPFLESKVGNGRLPVGLEQVTDTTTLCNFRHLLEKREPGGLLLASGMSGNGFKKLSGGTIVDATGKQSSHLSRPVPVLPEVV